MNNSERVLALAHSRNFKSYNCVCFPNANNANKETNKCDVFYKMLDVIHVIGTILSKKVTISSS